MSHEKNMSAYGIAVRNLTSTLALAGRYNLQHGHVTTERIQEAEKDYDAAQSLQEMIHEQAVWYAFKTAEYVLGTDAFPQGSPELVQRHAQLCAGYRSASVWMADHVAYLLFCNRARRLFCDPGRGCG